MSIATTRGRLVALLMLAVLALAAAGLFAWCTRTPPEVRANEAILATFPVYPGAVEVAPHHSAYNFRDGVTFYSPAQGWSTRVTYRVPPGTTEEDVRAFYETAPDPSWRRETEVTPILELSGATPPPPGSSVTVTPPPPPVKVGEVVHLSFCRGDARVGLDTLNVEQNGQFDLGADASYSEPGYRGPC